jgi:hypothetical protein
MPVAREIWMQVIADIEFTFEPARVPVKQITGAQPPPHASIALTLAVAYLFARAMRRGLAMISNCGYNSFNCNYASGTPPKALVDHASAEDSSVIALRHDLEI